MNRRSVYAWEPRPYGAWKIHDYPATTVADLILGQIEEAQPDGPESGLDQGQEKLTWAKQVSGSSGANVLFQDIGMCDVSGHRNSSGGSVLVQDIPD